MDAGRVVEDVAVVAAAAAAWAGISALRARRRTKAPGAAPAPASADGGGSSTADAPATERGRVQARAFVVVPPSRLPTFAAVGGLSDLKTEMRDTFGLVLAHPKEADAYRIAWNGLLLHGPPGVGKSFFARALAGEFRTNFIPVATADLVSEYAGAGPGLVERVFTFARSKEPAVLFFDEFGAVAQARDVSDTPSTSDILRQLLQSVEATRGDHRLLVVAATNDLDDLDPAVIRPGRFDRHVRLDLPDTQARAEIFDVALDGRPVAKDISAPALAAHSQGRTPAAIITAVDSAALAAFRQSAGTGRLVRITQADLLAALDHSGGHDRPTVENWSWKRIILPPGVLAELRELQTILEDPEQCRRFGIDQPSGLLLAGPPGTGKTTIAKILAAEAACSFYPVSGADVTSRWVGESERLIARLFHRARDNAPSIIFIDELDAIGSGRGELGAYDRQLDQLLQEIDGMAGQGRVFVVGASNRPDTIDSALLRGGRLSRTITIPLPDVEARRAILKLLTAAMPLHGVDLDELAADTDGFSGADLRALCQQAAVEAMIRSGHASAASISSADVARALSSSTTAPSDD
jgi:transitional endoplasmic reticulum ATPase